MSVEVGDILKIVATLLWTDGNIVQNVFAALVDGGTGPFDDQDIVDDCLDWIENMYNGNHTGLSDELDGSQVQVYKYDSVDEDFDEVGTNAWTYNPDGTADQLPRGVAMLLTAGTVNPDVQGKKYLAGLTEAQVTDGLIIGAMLTTNLAFAADWILDFAGTASGADFNPGVWSPTDLTFYEMVDSISASAIPAYQRRRKRGVGA